MSVGYMTVVVPPEDWDAFRLELMALLIKHHARTLSDSEKLEDIPQTGEIDVQPIPTERKRR